MADTKISALTELAVEPATDDVFPIVDTSAVTTKKITWAVLKAIFPTHALATAANDFLVATGSGAWAKQTLAQVKTTLGLLALAYKATVGTADIDADAVTYAKIQNVSATNKLLGRYTASAGDVEEVGLAADHAFSAGSLQLGAFTGDITKSAGSLTTTVLSASTSQAGKVELATTAEIDTGTDSTRAIPVDQFVASARNVRFFLIRVVESATNCAAGTTKGGDIEVPFTGTITEIGAYVDTAGVTGTMTVDVNKNGTTIMTTNKITIDTAEKSSRTAATAPALTTTAVTAGDLLTIDIDAIQTTPAKGLTVRIGIRQS